MIHMKHYLPVQVFAKALLINRKQWTSTSISFEVAVFLTRRLCCRREPLHNASTCAESLHLNLGQHNEQKEHWHYLQSANIGKLSKNHFTTVPVKDWCMSPHGIMGPPDKRSQNSVNKFQLARPLTMPNFVKSPTKSLRDTCCGNIFSPVKQAKVHPRSPDLSPIDRQYTSFYRHSVVTLALDYFVSEISLVLYCKCHFCTYRPRLSPKIWRCSPRVRSMSSVMQWARLLAN